MQSLWSRAARTRSCSCISCVQAANVVARNATTGVSKRRLRAGDIFTACYSAMFATAALADLKIKGDRRKQWDEAIESVKSGLEVPTLAEISAIGGQDTRGRILNSSKSRHLPVKPDLPLFELYYRSFRASKRTLPLAGELESTLSRESYATSLDSQFRMEYSHVRQEASPSISEDKGKEVDCIEENFRPRDQSYRELLDQMQNVVARLVIRLLLETKAHTPRSTELGEDKKVSDDHSNTWKSNTSPREVLSLSTRLPLFFPLSVRSTAKEHRRLDRSIEAIFSHNSRLDLMISKVCYNLLISQTPPSAKTYAIMIKHLTRLQHHDLARVVVQSLIAESPLNPSNSAIAAMLDHYRVTFDEQAFNNLTKQISSAKLGLRVTRHEIYKLRHPAIQKWALNTNAILRDGYLYEQVQCDSDIFNALIRGSAELLNFREPLNYLNTALRNGIHVANDAFHSLLDKYVAVKNDGLTIRLMAVLLVQFRNTSFLYHGITYDTHIRQRIYLVLKACGIESIYGEDWQVPEELDPILFNRMIRHLQFEEIRDAFNDCAARVSKLEKRLASAMLTGDIALLSAKLDVVETELISSIYGDLPSPRQETYNEAVREAPEMVLADRYDVLLRLWREWTSSLAEASNNAVMGNLSRLEIA